MCTPRSHLRLAGPARGAHWLRMVLVVAMAVLGPEFLWSADDAQVAIILGLNPDLATGAGHPVGASAPQSAAKPAAYLIKWDKYRTLVVVDNSAGLLRPAWIVTFATAPEEIETLKGKVTISKDQVVVAYRGQAYHDHGGVLHIDAHRAMIMGVLSDGGWSPDSFDIGADMMVTTHDDDSSHAGNDGVVERIMLPSQQAEEYHRLLLMAQSIIEGNS